MLKAIVTGISISVILQVLVMKVAGYAYECCFDAQSAPPLWYAMLSSPLGTIASLLPGFIAGWLYPRRGIAAGFVTGLVGNTIYSAVFLTMWGAVFESGALSFVEMIVRLLFLASSWALGNAAAGGTAQLLRSNKQFQPIGREDAPSG
jgi:uncharacterized membrane protein YeaQ/YmgE (transglycosylase-associated protein family)